MFFVHFMFFGVMELFSRPLVTSFPRLLKLSLDIHTYIRVPFVMEGASHRIPATDLKYVQCEPHFAFNELNPHRSCSTQQEAAEWESVLRSKENDCEQGQTQQSSELTSNPSLPVHPCTDRQEADEWARVLLSTEEETGAA